MTNKYVKNRFALCGSLSLSRGVVVKGMDLRNRNKRVRTPSSLLRSFPNKYPWELYEPPYPPSYELYNISLFF